MKSRQLYQEEAIEHESITRHIDFTTRNWVGTIPLGSLAKFTKECVGSGMKI